MNIPGRHAKVTLRELIIQSVILVALLAAVYPGTFLRGEITLPGDILYIADPWKQHAPAEFTQHQNPVLFDSICQHTLWYGEAQAAIREGEWPLWNHLQNAGIPLHANYQSTVFYPSRLFHLVFDNYVAITLFYLLKLWLCGATAYICGRGMRLGVAASRFLSVAWMLCSYNLLWSYWPEPDVAAWLPVLFLGVEYLLQGRYRRGFWVEALGAVLILLAGHPESAFTMGYGVGMYFFLRLITQKRWGGVLWKPICFAGCAWAAAIVVTAVQWLPFVEYLTQSFTFLARTEGESTVTKLPVGAILALWVPKFFGFTPGQDNFWGAAEHSNYVTLVYPGIAVWLGMLLLTTKRGDAPSERGRIICLLVPSVFGFLLAFDLDFVQPIQQLPLFSSMWRIWHIGFAVFAMPLIGALGVERWFSQPRRQRELVWVVLAAILVGACVLGIYDFNSKVLEMRQLDHYVRIQMWTSLAFLCLGLAVLTLYCVWRGPRLLPALLTVLLAADLVIAVRGHHVTVPHSWMFPRTPMTDYLKGMDQPIRVCSATAAIQTGLIPVYGIEQWLAYDGLYPMRVKRLQTTFGKELWGTLEPVCAITHYLHLPEITPLFPLHERDCYELVTTLDGLEIYKNNDALPRARLVGKVKVFGSVDEMFEFARTPEFDPKTTVLLEEQPPGPAPDNASADLGTASITRRTSTSVTVGVDAKEDAVLVLADAYFPGWKAWVDGRPTEIFPVYSAFRGLLVPAGHYTVEFRYEPWSFSVGLGISAVSLLTLVAIAGYSIARANRPTGQER